MTTVEELRTKKDLTPEESARIDLECRIDALTGQMLGQTYTNDYEFNKKLLGILTDAVDLRARQEGRAEGAEQVKERLVVYVKLNDKYISPSDLLRYLDDEIASVLAPATKEKP